MRKFEKVTGYDRAIIPSRQTAFAAGYDFHAYESVSIPPQSVALIPTGIKAKFPPDEVLKLYVRSSIAFKRGLMLANGTGVVDADYYNNSDNEGHIQFLMFNYTDKVVEVVAEERIGQGIFVNYHKTSDDQEGAKREGGFGSSN